MVQEDPVTAEEEGVAQAALEAVVVLVVLCG